MRKFYLAMIILQIITTSSVVAQDLLESRRSSYYTFIYKINNEQAKTLYKDIWNIDTTLLQNLFDFYPTDSVYKQDLPVGHYAFIKTKGSNLECELKSVNNLNMNLLNNHRDLILVFNDLQGEELPNLKVEVRSKGIPFQESIKAYRLEKSNKRGLVSVEFQGHVSYFEINRKYNNTFFVRTGKKIARTFPINHLISPIFYIQRNIQRLVNGNRLAAPGIYHRIVRTFKAAPRSGYIVLNKPQFKPYDTIRIKGIVTSRKGRPIGKNVYLYLTDKYSYAFTKRLGKIESYRKGAYQFDFTLSDSLNLKLDQTYSIEFRNKKGQKLLSTNFQYEDYQLKNNSYYVRSEQRTKLKPATLYLKGEDSNGLSLFDARAEILLKPTDVLNYYQSKVFVPDTLWFYKINLDPVGETKINIPDSIFAQLSIRYEAIVSFFNTENERTVETLSLDYDAQSSPIEIKIESDSVKVSSLDLQNPVTNEVILRRSNSNKIIDTSIRIPYKELVDPFADWYSVHNTQNNNPISDKIKLAGIPANVQVISNRTKDSLTLMVENPRKLLLRYFLFKNKVLIRSSQGESIMIKKKANPSDNYSFSIQYVWAGNSTTEDYEIKFKNRNLDIKIDHPAIIHPGQKANFKITVHDAFGKPVENVDLTAFAVTKKFETSSSLTIPSFSKFKNSRTLFNEFKTTSVDLNVSKGIEWTYWKKTLGLDSLSFYKLLFPQAGYFEFRTKSEVSQFAPFVVSRGYNQSIQIIYVDGQPVYYHGRPMLQPYSFHITPGEHTIEIRLYDRLVTLTKVKIEPNQKLLFSIDKNNLPVNCFETEMPTKFSEAELKKLSRHFTVVKTQDRQSSGYIQQGNFYQLIGPENYEYSYPEKLLGPFFPGPMTYYNMDGFQHTTKYQPFFSYHYQESQLTKESISTENYLNRGFSWMSEIPSFKDQVFTERTIKEYRKELERKKPLQFRRFPDYQFTSAQTGRLTVNRLPKDAVNLPVRATFVVNLENPDYSFIIAKDLKNYTLDAGRYQAILIFENEHYLKADSLEIKAYGNNYYNLESLELHKPDTLSSQLFRTIKKWSTEEYYPMLNRQKELQKVRELFYQESSSDYNFNHFVSGKIVSIEDGSPLPGVNVILKGTTIGTVSDMNGDYSMNCPANGVLIFSFIGLQSQEVPINNQFTHDIQLVPDIAQLSEIVITAYGVEMEKRSLTSSISTILSGRIAGLSLDNSTIRYEVEDSLAVLIRGQSSIQGSSEPLIIVDGVLSRLEDIDKNKITEMVVLKDKAATAIYGSRASGGVILITTKPGVTKEELKELSKSALNVPALENLPGNELRKNFRDYAFWKPSLKTDKNGMADFEVTFPDDITGWNAHVLGMRNKLTGITHSVIKSYKPLVAQIAQPQFLVDGDSIYAIGKITNYTQNEIELERTIKCNEAVINKSILLVKDSKIDSIQLTPKGSDTLAVFYSVTTKNYTDGELRKLPVYSKGVKEAKGYFVPLLNDTSVTLNFTNTEKVKIYAQADLLDVFLDEIQYLKNYPYECNEQQASRLMALLLEKKIKAHKNEAFYGTRDITKLIRKLIGNQNKDGSWSWWGTGKGNILITLHVARSLDLAQKDGFQVFMNKESLINYLVINLANTKSNTNLDAQLYLLELGQKLQVTELIDSIQRSVTTSLHEKLQVLRLNQLSGGRLDWNWINSRKSQTIKGNCYWGENQLNLSDNSVHNTLLVYKMIEKENPLSKELVKIRNYFLEQRNQNWRNTYESSLILATILPNILADKKSNSTPSLQLTGLSNQKIDKFPFEQMVTGGETLTISKSGQLPVYFTAYQESWNHQPTKSGTDFSVSTHFEGAPQTLHPGKPVKLVIDVEVKKDAEYVMIEVPIPAGCSYESKPQLRVNGEVHREYYNHKTNIYCQYMKQGKYSYTISLVPRYTGSYTLNPVVVESMYFPTINGQEGIKRVVVR